MKANEFFKKYGWEYAKHILADDAPLVMDLNYADLKRLVESHELVEHAGGLDSAKKQIELKDSEDNCLWCVDLKIAIADVESCMEVPSEPN